MTEPDADDALDRLLTLVETHFAVAPFVHAYRSVPFVAPGWAAWQARTEGFRQRVARSQVPGIARGAEPGASSAVVAHRLTSSSAASMVGISDSAVRKARRMGRLTGHLAADGSTYEFSIEEVERFMMARRSA